MLENTAVDAIEDIFGAAKDGDSARGEPAASSGDHADAARSELMGDMSREQTEPMSSLASYVMGAWRVNYDARRSSGVTDRLDYALKSYKCSYTVEQQQKMRAAGIDPRVYSPVTFSKTRAAKSMLVELVNSSSDALFTLDQSPDPFAPRRVMEKALAESEMEIRDAVTQIAQSGIQEIPPEAQEKLALAVESGLAASYDSAKAEGDEWARTRARRMERKVWDTMVEGHFQDALLGAIDDACIYGTGVVVGPILRTESANECSEDENGVVSYRRVYKTRPVFERVSPYDCYPAPDAVDVTDGALCIRTKFTAADLWRMSGQNGGSSKNGWIVPMVDKVLARHPEGGVRILDTISDSEHREEELKDPNDANDCMYEGVRCFAPVRGSMLIEMGVTATPDGKKIETRSFYRTETVVVDGIVVFCQVYDERYGVPVSKCSFYELPGSWWGESIADKLYMCQSVQNNAIKALLRNFSVASGAQFWINGFERMQNKSDLGWRPLKTWIFGRSMDGMNSGAPMGVMDVPMKGVEIMNVFKDFRTQADLDSGIPSFTEGQSAGASGSLRTSSGLAMYMESANRGMKMVLSTIDRLLICRCARMVADWILVNDDDMDIKGDVEVRPVGLMGRILKAQRDQLRQQLLSMVLNSQYLQQNLGPKAVMTLFRPSVKDVDVNPDDVIPNEERLKEIEYLEKIGQVIQAMSGAQNAAAEQREMAGAPPGVPQPEQPEPQGGVAERRSVA